MRLNGRIIAVLAMAGLGLVGRAYADDFIFTYTDGEGNSATGTLDATLNGGVGTQWTAISGTMDLLTSGLGDSLGEYSLISNPNAPGIGFVNNPIGGYNDELYFPASGNIDGYGLLFGINGNSTEINIYGGGPTSNIAGLLDSNGNDSNGNGTFVLSPSPTPEPFTAGLGVAGVGLAVRRRLKSKAASAN